MIKPILSLGAALLVAVSMSACGYDRSEAADAMVAADDVKGREPCRRRIHNFARDLEVCAGWWCKLHQDGVRHEARFLFQCPEVYYRDSMRG